MNRFSGIKGFRSFLLRKCQVQVRRKAGKCCGDLEKGSEYNALNKCIVINFLDFELFSHEKMHAVFHIAEDDMLIVWTEFLGIRDETELIAMSSKNCLKKYARHLKS